MISTSTAHWRSSSPIILFLLRVTQGLALGGEYGGAAAYVGEHAPQGKRGFYTSWIQTTATLGLFLALAVILVLRLSMSAEVFKAWGWRIPFLLSFILLVISVYIRLKLQESPVFVEMKSRGKGSRTPLRDSFLKMPNAKYVWLALFGATAGRAGMRMRSKAPRRRLPFGHLAADRAGARPNQRWLCSPSVDALSRTRG